uniref:Maestro/Maestro-like HEAT-repeats domain-containing protein n=1 Tax=Ornithorhynchus anatinus TaxID=9258 RepID=F6U724_ORNAN
MDRHVVELWRAVGSEPHISPRVLLLLLEKLEERPSLEQICQIEEETYPESLAAMNTLYEMLFVPEYQEALHAAYPRLFFALVTQIHYIFDLDLLDEDEVYWKGHSGQRALVATPCRCPWGRESGAGSHSAGSQDLGAGRATSRRYGCREGRELGDLGAGGAGTRGARELGDLGGGVVGSWGNWGSGSQALGTWGDWESGGLGAGGNGRQGGLGAGKPGSWGGLGTRRTGRWGGLGVGRNRSRGSRELGEQGMGILGARSWGPRSGEAGSRACGGRRRSRPLSAPALARLGRSTSVEAVKSLFSKNGFWQEFAFLELQEAWDQLAGPLTYCNGVCLLARAMVEFHSPRIPGILLQALTMIQKEEDRQRMVAMIFFTEFLRSPAMANHLARHVILGHLTRGIRDPNLVVRVASLHGFSIVFLNPEKERQAVRGAAISAFGNLVGSLEDKEPEVLKDQVCRTLIPLFFHFLDEDKSVVKKAKLTFFRCASFLQWDELGKLFRRLAWEDGLRGLHSVWKCFVRRPSGAGGRGWGRD